jgi:hypothetical protein
MKYTQKILSTFILLLTLTYFNSCKKTEDPSLKFIGRYSFSDSGVGISNRYIEISNIGGSGSNKISLAITKDSNPSFTIIEDTIKYFTVVGDTIKEDSGHTVTLSLYGGAPVIYNETAIGVLQGSSLILNGWWKSTGQNTLMWAWTAAKIQ